MSERTPTDPRRSDAPFAVVRGRGPVPAALQGAVAALGNFDGLHRGHRTVLAAARDLAAGMSRPAVLLTFEPHPRAFFRPQDALFRLTPEPVKLATAAALGLDGAVVLPFDATLAATTAEEFVRDILGRDLHLGGVAAGHDFHFGKGRAGTPGELARLAASCGLASRIVEPLLDGAEPVSSSAIRAALAEGDVARAGMLIGSRWIVRSTVQHGDKRGRTLGFPTANLKLEPGCSLRHGIYAVRAALDDGRVVDGVASFGRRPTFDDGAPLLEVFLFDFAGDLYGRVVDVEFVAWIRGEEKFDSVDALVARMAVDSATAREALGRAAAGEGAPSLLPLPRVG
ncbi:bifunctional riboflavin kinase/FAD synthetase [Alsobacter sp. R-9]